MKQYKTVNNLLGWLTFIIAGTVYCLTIEPTASFWDCPEFITTAAKLEVGHPPGAPFFMLTGNLFSQFASDSSAIAKMINYMSALLSGACIMFLFWTITHLVRRLTVNDYEEINITKMITIMGSGLVGAMAFTFSDTFWYSAVEGEVYAFSSLFTAVVFWLILKWEDAADQPHADRWLVLIAYLTGLSIGVHLLNLLCLPAIVLVYYYKRVPNADLKGSLLALIGSGALVGIVLYGIVPGVVKVGGVFEIFFVNMLGMGFNMGVLIYCIVVAAAIIWGVYETYTDRSRKLMNISFLLTLTLLGIPFYGHGVGSVVIGIIVVSALAAYLFLVVDKKYRLSARAMNTAMLCTMMIMVGYASYAVIVLRSMANTPMDQNSPEDIFTLGEYLGREQYGTRPLFYGQTYASKVELKEENGYCVPVESSSSTKWIRKEKTNPNEKDSYIEVPGRTEYKYAQNMLFPRMYSSSHAQQYQSWVDIKGNPQPYDQCGEMITVNIPTQWENIVFFFRYQVNFMYWRYFMWNFAGRQNDIQGNGEIEHGNWITGIPFIDNILVGDQTLLPDELRENKGRNVFYCLPLILGIIGLLWQAFRKERGIQQFWVVFFLFFMTGLAIVLYLNQTPIQPRERDYAYAGSFYAFAIWIGMGVAGIVHLIDKYLKKNNAVTAAATSAVCLLVPVQMASQTWDDHDRSDRYVARDFGQNYLMSMQEEGNPIIFTNGDNDTFPLWYNQETEEFRQDTRTCNLSYLQTDWYIDQMKRPAYDSPALPITWDRIEYVEGTNEYVPIRPEYKNQINQIYAELQEKGTAQDKEAIYARFGENPYELKNILNYWVRNNSQNGGGFIPTDSIVIKLDKEAIRRSGMAIPAALGDSIPDYMSISLKGKRALYKSELMMLEMLANANWERPMYMAVTVGSENRLGMDKHFVQEGLASRFTPFNTQELGATIDSEKMYDNLMNKFKFGGIETPGIYLDENTMRMVFTHRRLFGMLAEQLLKEGKKEKALEVLDYAEVVIPEYNVPYDWQNGALQMAESYYRLGEKDKANKIMEGLADKSVQYLTWYLSLRSNLLMTSSREVEYHLALLNEEVKVLDRYNPELGEVYGEKLDEIYGLYVQRVKEKR